MKSLSELSSKPGFLFRRLNQTALSVYNETTNGIELTPVQYVVLQVLAFKPGIDQITLSQCTMIDRSMTARVVEVLAKRGLIDKRPEKSDRRANTLQLTKKGAKLLRASTEKVVVAQKRILEPLPPAQRKEFVRMIKTILAAHENRR